jgi:hypothetical protein
VSVKLVESSSDPAPWRRVAKRAIVTIRVTSREALPSGADPGLDVSALCIPIQKGRGEKSARIDILDITPQIETEKIELDSGQFYEVATLEPRRPRPSVNDASPVEQGRNLCYLASAAR